ncbi:M15 family metallopeptidase [Streptomyces sp. WAC08241]|uniref:M15 family metallopeptidase n=1 Tax=Streptomyces sp. WAC08241 TaxID=2487421 RepID=UPI001C8EF41C|nr:M15 family metallopeptidase [Streptomyces sp. WAC08241]
MSDRLPAGFVALSDFDPAIRQDLRYAGADNFVGEPLDGYQDAVCLLTEPAARALGRAHGLLRRNGYGLTVWDAYRPQRAVDHMRRWARDPYDTATKRSHYPRVAKRDLFGPHYIHSRSGHSRGSTVDLTLTTPDGDLLDMGTGFDFFDPRSHTDHPGLTPVAHAHRQVLLHAMTWAGFRNLPTEWWHFTLAAEPYTTTYFDVPSRRTPRRPGVLPLAA